MLDRKGKGGEEEEYRLVQDGIHAIIPYITTRKVRDHPSRALLLALYPARLQRLIQPTSRPLI